MKNLCKETSMLKTAMQMNNKVTWSRRARKASQLQDLLCSCNWRLQWTTRVWGGVFSFNHYLTERCSRFPAFLVKWIPPSELNAQNDREIACVSTEPWDRLLPWRNFRFWYSKKPWVLGLHAFGAILLLLSCCRDQPNFSFNCNWFSRSTFSYRMPHRIWEKQNHSVFFIFC